MKKITYLVSCFMLLSIFSQAQHNHDRCGSDHIRSLNQSNPVVTQKRADIERFTEKWIAENEHLRTGGAVITIPIVIHVVWNDPIENISDVQIQSQIDALNRDFRKQNADTTQIPSAFQSLAADMEIEFCLAKRDANGLPTTGINRVQTTINEIGNFNPALGIEVPQWDTSSYLNIYVCEITDGGFVLGYATFPGSPLGGNDAIVMDYRYFGTTSNIQPPFNLGRTLPHEVGHYLNLSHIWGDTGGCADDDNVADTPDQDFSYSGCPTFPQVSCGSNDMFVNYMDYSDDACLLMFTPGQKLRMLAALNGPRAGLLTSMGCQPSVNVTHFVNHAATGANNGTSWADAFTDLSEALDSAKTTDQVWVAQGTYTPGGANPTVDSYFPISHNIKLYGGFNGTETNINQRDPILNETILSADLQGNDIDGDLVNNRTDNSTHVMIVDTGVTNLMNIDGFTFRSGHGSDVVVGNGNNRRGGGILSFGSPHIFNCVFKDNRSLFGGAIYPRFEDASDIIIENCDFINNHSTANGGAILVFDAGALIENCTFDGNTSAAYAGAIRIGDSEVDIVNCVFENNSATLDGGAIWGANSAAPSILNIENCDFVNNEALGTTNGGGAICILTDFIVDISSSIFDGNTSEVQGGAIYTEDSDVTLTNSLLINNEARSSGYGGAICNLAGLAPSKITIINSTIANNHGAEAGGICQVEVFATPTLAIGNTILSNSNGNYSSPFSPTATVVSLLGNISSDSSLANAFTHIIDLNNTDPLFEDPSNDDFHLAGNSPAHDLGVMANAPSHDLDGLERVGHPESGAYEYPFFVSTEEEPTALLEEDIKVYPNPTSDMLTLEVNGELSGELYFQLIDITGKMIKAWSNEKYGNTYQEQISTKHLANGLYQIMIIQGGESKVVRFSKL